MSKWAALSGSNRTVWGAAALVAVVAAGYWFHVANRAGQIPSELMPAVDQADTGDLDKKPVPQTESDSTSHGADNAPVTAEQDVAEEQDVAPALPTAQTAPTIDEVRLESDGLAVIAGRATPGSTVSVLVDGEENIEVTTDARGSFAAVTVISTKADAQELTIVQRDGDNKIASSEQVILAPTKALIAAGEGVSTSPDAKASQVETDVAKSDPASEQTDTPKLAALSDSATPQPDETSDAENTETADTVSKPAVPDVAADQSDDAAQAVAGSGQEPETPTPPTEPAARSGTDVASLQEDEPAPVDPNSAEQGVTILKSTPDGVEVLSNNQPQALENISIDTISYSDAGDVQLSGRAQSKSKVVRVYVDNRRVADLAVDPDGQWRGDLPAIDTGVYTLRVDQVDSSGDVTSRVETPFKREDPQVLAEADDPATLAIQITVQTGNTLWAIARDRYGEGRLYVQVFEANKDSIRDPDLIYPGQVFALPDQ